MCTRPVVIKREIAGRSEYIQVPCGKCDECQKIKQNDTCVLCVRTALQYGSMVFATFTYRNDTLPFVRCRVSQIEGEEPVLEYCDENESSYIRDVYFSEFLDCHSSIAEGDYVFSPSVKRYEWRMWLKYARIAYQRRHGERLPDFAYCCIPEYGTRTGRPHYHCLFFGLTKLQVEEICMKWRKDKGFVDVQEIPQFTPKDPTKSQYEAVAKYIGKYMAKGSFQDTRIEQKLLEKPRRMTSIGFGDMAGVDALKSYYLCYDMFGAYDINDRKFLNGLSINERNVLCEEIIKRRKYNINGKSYRLPEKIKRKVFYYPVKKNSSEEKVVTVYKSSEVLNLVSSYVRNRIFKDSAGQLRAFTESYGDTEIPLGAFKEFIIGEREALRDREQTHYANFKITYQKSRF